MKNLNDLFLHGLMDVYYAEQQIVKSLPKLAQAAQSEALKKALSEHRQQTETQVKRLEQVFQTLGQRAQGVTCEALLGLVKETEDLLKETGSAGPVQDAGLIACAQAVEHYEIARYGALIAWAKQMGQQQIVSLLQETLEEEKQADALLNQLAEGNVNQAAAGA